MKKLFQKLDFNYVKEYIESFKGYTLLSDGYINCSKKLKIKCPNNHIFEITFNSFQQNRRCKQCDINNRRLSHYHVKEYIKSFNYDLLKDYVNAITKLEIMCPKGHIFFMKFNHFKEGHRCRECYKDSMCGSNNPSWNKNRDLIPINKKIRRPRSKTWIIKNMKDDPNYEKFLNNPEKYQLDHIIPISIFSKLISERNFNEEKIIKIANKKENLQILLKEDNIKKRDKYNETGLIKFINEFYY